jgi:hypothetical protein
VGGKSPDMKRTEERKFKRKNKEKKEEEEIQLRSN